MSGESIVQHLATAVYVVGRVEGEKKTLLLYHRKLDAWLPPGGHVDVRGESLELPHECALREVREETGLSVEFAGPRAIEYAVYASALKEVTRSKQLPTPHHMQVETISPGHFHIDCVYFARAPIVEGAVHDEKESSSIRWCSAMEIKKMEEEGVLWKEVAYFAQEALSVVEV